VYHYIIRNLYLFKKFIQTEDDKTNGFANDDFVMIDDKFVIGTPQVLPILFKAIIKSAPAIQQQALMDMNVMLKYSAENRERFVGQSGWHFFLVRMLSSHEDSEGTLSRLSFIMLLSFISIHIIDANNDVKFETSMRLIVVLLMHSIRINDGRCSLVPMCVSCYPMFLYLITS
jgi:hypothetical protein